MDYVDTILEQWGRERPDLDVSAMGVVGRLSRLSQNLSRELGKTFASFGLNGASFDMLATLRRAGGENGLTPGELMDQTMVTSGTMTHRVDQLVKAGFVERHKVEGDGRSVRVRLTGKGRGLIDEAVVAHVATMDRLISPLDAADRDAMINAMRILLEQFEAGR